MGGRGSSLSGKFNSYKASPRPQKAFRSCLDLCEGEHHLFLRVDVSTNLNLDLLGVPTEAFRGHMG